VRAEFPEIPVILVSGYAEIEQANLPNSDFELVQLPFHPAILLSAVKRVMVSQRTPSSDGTGTAS
jgi:DNA-binding NtrC family response regulator